LGEKGSLFGHSSETVQGKRQRCLKLNQVAHTAITVLYRKGMPKSPHRLRAGCFTLGCILTKFVPIFTGKTFILYTILDKLIIAKLDKNPLFFLASKTYTVFTGIRSEDLCKVL